MSLFQAVGDLGATEAWPAPGVRWRDVYGKAPGECGAKTRAGVPCRLPGAGCGGRCKFHGGESTGPRTAAGRARSAMNGRARRHKLEKKMHSTQLPTDDARHAHDGDATVAVEPAPAPRPPLLETLLAAHLRGERRWPLAAKILAAVDRGPMPLTRGEVLAALPEPGVDRVIGMLLARGVLVEQPAGKKAVLLARTHGAA